MSAGAPGTPPATGTGPGSPTGNPAASQPSGNPSANGNPPAPPPASANARSGAEDEETSELNESERDRNPKGYYEKLERENVRRRLANSELRTQLNGLTTERDSLRTERDALQARLTQEATRNSQLAQDAEKTAFALKADKANIAESQQATALSLIKAKHPGGTFLTAEQIDAGITALRQEFPAIWGSGGRITQPESGRGPSQPGDYSQYSAAELAANGGKLLKEYMAAQKAARQNK